MSGESDTLDGSILLPFGEEERLFRLGMDQLFALEEKRGCAFAELHDRLMRGAWSIADVVETLRLGLIGGGMELRTARELVERCCLPGRIEACATLAFHVLAVVMDAPRALRVLGKGGAAVDASGATGASPSSPSMASPPAPGSIPSASAGSPSGAMSPSSKVGTKPMRTRTPRRSR